TPPARAVREGLSRSRPRAPLAMESPAPGPPAPDPHRRDPDRRRAGSLSVSRLARAREAPGGAGPRRRGMAGPRRAASSGRPLPALPEMDQRLHGGQGLRRGLRAGPAEAQRDGLSRSEWRPGDPLRTALGAGNPRGAAAPEARAGSPSRGAGRSGG